MESKISFVEGFLLILCAIIIDVLDVALEFLFGAGLIFDSLMDLFIGPMIQLYLNIRGINGAAWLAGWVIEIIPGLNALPTLTITMVLTIYFANKPKVAQVASLASG